MMEEEILVSIIIPMYNAGLYIKETIESVLNQTWKNIEIIVVDDGSTDDSYEIVAQYVSESVHLYSQPNQGAPMARNRGFKEAHGDYIQYLDADDILSPNKIKKQLLALHNSGKNDIAVCTFFQYIDGKKQKEWESLQRVNRNYENGMELQENLWKNYVPSYIPSCYLTPRHIIEKAGEWNETLTKNQDGEFFARVLRNVQRVVFIDEEYVLWRYLPDSISHSHSACKADSMVKSYIFIASLLLSKERDLNAVRDAIGVAFGNLLYNDIITYKQMRKILSFSSNLDIKPIYPSNSFVFRWTTRCLNPLIGRKVDCLYKLIKTFVWKHRS